MATRTFTQTRTLAPTQSRTEPDIPNDGIYRVDFGTHRGRTLDQVPPAWIRWVIDGTDIVARNAELRQALIQRGNLTSDGKPVNASSRVRRGTPTSAATGTSRPSRTTGKPTAGKGSSSSSGNSAGGFKPFGGSGNTLG